MQPEDLTKAANDYRDTFGHAVPVEVIRLFATRPGLLVVEIRQAIALRRAVPGWRSLSRKSDLAGTTAFPPAT